MPVAAMLAGYGYEMPRRVWGLQGPAPTVRTFQGGGTQTAVLIRGDDTMDSKDITIRRLTPRECFRLQAFGEDTIRRLEEARREDGRPAYPPTFLYKLAGNSICVEPLRLVMQACADALGFGPGGGPGSDGDKIPLPPSPSASEETPEFSEEYKQFLNYRKL